MPQRAGPNGKVVGMRLREGPSVTSRGVANLQVVRTLFDAIGRGDLEAIRPGARR